MADGLEDAKGSEVEKKITPTALKKLLKDLRAKKDDIDELSGQMGSAVEKVSEKFHINRKALSLIRQLDRMPAEKLGPFWDDVLYMMDASGLSDRAQSAPRLAMGDEDKEAEGKPANGHGGNVKPFRAPESVQGA